ncbi:NAD(P)-binding protein [Earliella scabrosa]|nr:NAD(P)-binding protein [Earliella scabrosa]
MPSYVVTGASRGLGLEFVRQLSEDETNIVFAAVRNPQSSAKLLALQKSAPNVHIIKADLSDADSWQASLYLPSMRSSRRSQREPISAAATEVGKVTGGSLDYLINNAAYISEARGNLSIHEFPDAKTLEDDLVTAFRTNVAGVAHTINAFLPLLRAGPIKKVVTLSTGLADIDVIVRSGFSKNPQYPISKAALNMLVAEYAAALEHEGFTFLAISPGLVNTAEKPPTPEELEGFKAMVAQFKKYAPEWDGIPLTPETSVKLMRDVIEEAGPKDSGTFLSQYGNQKWL